MRTSQGRNTSPTRWEAGTIYISRSGLVQTYKKRIESAKMPSGTRRYSLACFGKPGVRGFRDMCEVVCHAVSVHPSLQGVTWLPQNTLGRE